MKRTVNFGKVNWNHTKAGRQNLITVDIELKDTDDGPVFSASASVWNNLKTDIICGGQCFYELQKHGVGKGWKKLDLIVELWEKYHLNDMHAGCEHQRELGWEKDGYEKHPSEHCPTCGYEFGTAWIYSPIPEEDLARIRNLIAGI